MNIQTSETTLHDLAIKLDKLVTKDEFAVRLDKLATKDELVATKRELAARMDDLATKEDVADLARMTANEFKIVHSEMHDIKDIIGEHGTRIRRIENKFQLA